MSMFWMLAGLLVTVALLFILPPLLRKPRVTGVQRDALNVQVIKDQLDELRADLESGRLGENAYTAARHDLERALLNDVEKTAAPTAPAVRSGRWMAVVLLLLVPALAVTIYQRLGAEPTLEQVAAGKAAVQAAGGGPHALEAMVEKLAERMQQEPGNVEGWALLGRSYAAMNRFGDAARAYGHAVELAPDNPDILSSYADVLVTVSNGVFTDEVGQLLNRALAADPHHLKSLWLRGHWRYRHDDAAGAIEDWRTVIAALPPGDENVAVIERQIMLAQGQSVQALDDIVPAAQQGAGAAAAGQARIQVEVVLDPSLEGKVSPDDTLFVFARAVQGPRMPLAIVRKRVADLPLTVTLDDSQAMSPAMTLSKFTRVSIGARISKSGQAMPAAGDLQGTVSPVKTDGAEVKVTINEEVAPVAQKNAEAAPAARKPDTSVTASGGSIQVHVALDAALAARASPDDTVFIFARATQGPRMPLAIVRKRVADLPVDVTLDDSQAMSPAMVLSKFGEVTVGARVSKSGQAMPASGDLQGTLSPVRTDGAEVALTINQVVP